MSIAAMYRRTTPEKASQLLEGTKAGKKLPRGSKAGDLFTEVFSLEKEWHLLHFLLTGEADLEALPQPPPLGDVVMGGTETSFASRDGAARLLQPAQVAAIAAALGAISTADLQARFARNPGSDEEIYSVDPDASATEQLETLLELYPELVAFFERAAAAGDVVFLSLE